MDKIFIGPAVHCLSDGPVSYLKNVAIVVGDDGIIKNITKDVGDISNISTSEVFHLPPNSFLIPGFVDAHVHAPQYANLGLGADLPLLEWLDKYIFDLEKKFKDVDFSLSIYDKVIDRTILNGTTTASYYGTIHTESCLVLANLVHLKGQRGYVGKVNMNINCPSDYCEPTMKTFSWETEYFISEVLEKKFPIVKPILTPRFAVSCDMEMMKMISNLAVKHDLLVQTHVSENVNEIALVKSMHSDCKNYTEVYKKAGFLNKAILAHGVHLTDEELDIIKECEASIIHCPISNCFLQSGVCNVARLLEYGINVGLGTDMGAGYSPSILEVMRSTVDISSALLIHNKYQTNQNHLQNDTDKDKKCNIKPSLKSINYEKAFYMATLGGAKALQLDKEIGNFEVGKKIRCFSH